MCKVMVHDYSEVTEEERHHNDFSKRKTYIMDSLDAIKLIDDVIDDIKGHDYAFYSEDDTEYLLDLS